MSNENLIEQLRGYKATPRHCEELCYEAAGVIESMIQKLIAAQEESEFDHSEYRRLREELRKKLASRDTEVAELKQTCIDHVEIQQALRQQLKAEQEELSEFRNSAKSGFDRQLRDQKREVMLRDHVAKAAAHVKPTCGDLYEELIQALDATEHHDRS